MAKNQYAVDPPNHRMYNGNVYQPAPTMPSLEININQHNPIPVSPYHVSNVSQQSQSSPPTKRNPPSSAPPPVPSPPHPTAPPRSQTYSNTYNYVTSDAGGFFIDKFPKRENRGMFRLCLIECLLAAFVLGGGIWCAHGSFFFLEAY